MEFILISNNQKRFDVHCNPLIFSAVVLLLATIIFGGIYQLGAHHGIEQSQQKISNFQSEAGSLWEREIEEQQTLVKEAREDAEKHLDAMASRVSNLQSHILRLNALGSRLAKMAELDELEFDSGKAPGIGGPSPTISVGNSVPDFLTSLEQLSLDIQDREEKLTALETLLINRSLESKTLPKGSPLKKGWISSTFGWRTDPITGKKEFHEGMDFAGRAGTEITVAGAGIVTWSAKRDGYGNTVEVDHGNGYVTRYAHNKENLVKVGDRVEKGQVIALIGSTGRSTGLHVHFEVLHNGKPINPKKFIVSSQ